MAIQIHLNEKNLLPKLGHQIVAVYDWLSGPAMTELERNSRRVAEAQHVRNFGEMGL